MGLLLGLRLDQVTIKSRFFASPAHQASALRTPVSRLIVASRTRTTQRVCQPTSTSDAMDALRDLVLSPLSPLAALIDVLRAGSEPPSLFYAVLRLGRRSEDWIDLWSAGRRGQTESGEAAPGALNADEVLNGIEAMLRDPARGTRNAQVLARWARMRAKRLRTSWPGSAFGAVAW